MKKGLVVLLALMLSATMFAAKIGVVNYQKVIKDYQGYKDALDFLNKEKNRLQTDIDKRVKEYQADKEKLSKDATDKEKAELKRKADALNEYVKMMKQTLAKLEYDQMGKVKTDIEVAIKQIATQEKLEIVLDQQAVIYGGEDYTKKVIDFLSGAEKIDLK